MQRIPRGIDAIIPIVIQQQRRKKDKTDKETSCESFWVNWGMNRIALSPHSKTKTLGRGGFYIHDSQKLYTHGCIEVEPRFFDILRNYMKDHKRSKLYIHVKYLHPTVQTTWKDYPL